MYTFSFKTLAFFHLLLNLRILFQNSSFDRLIFNLLIFTQNTPFLNLYPNLLNLLVDPSSFPIIIKTAKFNLFFTFVA